MRSALASAATLLLVGAGPACTRAGHGAPARSAMVTARALPATLHGVTVDDVSDLGPIAESLRRLPVTATTRLYFDATQPPGYYAAAVGQLRKVSYLMGELLDSSDETSVSYAQHARRVSAYLSAFGPAIDIWEIGNEVNGDWTGRYTDVAAKLTVAYREVAARHLRSALTLYYNKGCGDGRGELDPVEFSRRYVQPSVRKGLSYVLLSYYEDQCGGARPSAAAWTRYFASLHSLYPNARLGFGEVGLAGPATAKTMSSARSLMRHYYGMRVPLPYYAGGYFWWYYAEDCVPHAKPLWHVLASSLRAGRTGAGGDQRDQGNGGPGGQGNGGQGNQGGA
jgi:hypothetical protein